MGVSVESVTTELLKRLLLLTFACAWSLSFPGHLAFGEEDQGDRQVTVRVVAVLSTDELGAKLRYPSSVYCDVEMDEIYVVSGGGESRIVVYGPNFFPVASLAGGRGADAPRGIYINTTNDLYVCQGKSASRPGRVTIFNPAFFPEREITFGGMPEGENFSPGNLVIGMTGNIYIAGLNTRGVMVLNKKGGFSHWLKPKDRIFDPGAVESVEGKETVPAEAEDAPADSIPAIGEDTAEDADELRKLLPPALLPHGRTVAGKEEREIIGPVKIVDVKRDSSGNLYLLSEETSKVYVYDAAEEFLFSFGRKGGSTGKMSRPKSLAIDEQKKVIYIVDYMRHTILIFGMSGRFMYEFGGLGSAPGWFQYPTGLALNREHQLLVADLFNHRVQVLDLRFEYAFPMFMTPEDDRESTGPENGPDQERPEGDEVLQPRPL